MNKLISTGILAGLLFTGWFFDIHLSVADKVNKAFPPRPEVRIQLETLQSLIPSDSSSLESFNNAYDSQMMLRAFSCTQGISLSRFDSVQHIQQLPIDRDCLKQKDDELLETIGINLVGFRLTQPPLRPLIKLGPPAIIHGVDGVEVYTGQSASKAGVAVLRGNRSEFISVEIPGGKKIVTLPTIPEGSHAGYSVSPNGRVLAIVVNNKDLRFIDNESGQDLWLARDVNQIFAWLPELQVALVRSNKNRTENGSLSLVDFNRGNIKPFDIAGRNQSWALNLSESPSRLLIGSHKDFSLIENTRTPEGVKATVVKDFRIKSPTGNVSSRNPTLMLDGKAIVFVSGRDFMLFNMETGEEKYWQSGEVVGTNYAKFSEDSILVDGHSFLKTGTTRSFILNIKDSTLSPVETVDGSEGIIYELNGRTGFMRRGYQKVWVGDSLQTGRSDSLDDLIEGRKLERQLQALEQEERLSRARLEALKSGQLSAHKEFVPVPLQPLVPRGIGLNESAYRAILPRERNRYPHVDTLPSGRQLPVPVRPAGIPADAPAMESPAAAPAAEAPAAAPATEMYSATANAARRQEMSNTLKRMLGDIPVNARVEGVGVYEAKDRISSGVNVIIKKSEQPIVLMLSAYEPVRWNLIKEPGANLAAVISTGYNLSQVQGAGSIKTVIKRGSYSYKQNGEGYHALNNEAILWAGKPFSKFQGDYWGTVFTVGN
jgi:hypothetical protein